MVVATFSKDESARPPTLLKTESITDILVGQVEKFQNNAFKENLWKVATAKQKHVFSEHAMEYARRNTECISLCFQFPKFRLVRYFTFSVQSYVQSAK